MHSQEMNSLVRIFIGEDARFDGKPLYESIVLKAREQGLAGATVLRGPMGLDMRAFSVQRKSCVSQEIFLLLSRLSIPRKKSLPFCRR
jgi:PII-like signaling protein